MEARTLTKIRARMKFLMMTMRLNHLLPLHALLHVASSKGSLVVSMMLHDRLRRSQWMQTYSGNFTCIFTVTSERVHGMGDKCIAYGVWWEFAWDDDLL